MVGNVLCDMLLIWFGAVADSGRDPSLGVAGDGYVRHLGPLRQSLRHAGQEEEDGDQSSPQNTRPGF